MLTLLCTLECAGIFEIGYAIEDPFQGTLRLSILCDTVRRDVLGDENIRSTAFQLEEKSQSEVNGIILRDLERAAAGNQTDLLP